MIEGFKKVVLNNGRASMSVTNIGTSFNGMVADMLRNPTKAELLIDEEGKRLAVQACGQDEHGTLTFKYRSDRSYVGARFNNQAFQSRVAELMGWDLDKGNFRIDGQYDPVNKAVIFSLEEAREFKKRNVKSRNKPQKK